MALMSALRSVVRSAYQRSAMTKIINMPLPSTHGIVKRGGMVSLSNPLDRLPDYITQHDRFKNGIIPFENAGFRKLNITIFAKKRLFIFIP